MTEVTELARDVNTPEYHLWTDVLHACALAEQANNAWDRSSYVRWTIITGWTVLEMLFRIALEDERIGHNFKKDVNQSIESLGLPKVNWGEGSWQIILELKEKRKIYVHTKLKQEELFLGSQIARRYINQVRESISFIYDFVSKQVPEWVNFSEDQGWGGGRVPGSNMIVERQGAKLEDPSSLVISYVYKEKECITEVLPNGSDYVSVALELAQTIRLAISAVKVSQGGVVIWEQTLFTRGSF